MLEQPIWGGFSLQYAIGLLSRPLVYALQLLFDNMCERFRLSWTAMYFLDLRCLLKAMISVIVAASTVYYT
jgi:hypothetical protein